MGWTDLDKYRKYQKEWNSKNRDLTRKNTKAYKQARRIYIQSLKEKPCADCKIQYPFYVMQFDHCNGKKEFSVSHMISYSKEKILKEVLKCEVVCANCHAIRTYNRTPISTIANANRF
jgi:hypothetical protein